MKIQIIIILPHFFCSSRGISISHCITEPIQEIFPYSHFSFFFISFHWKTCSELCSHTLEKQYITFKCCLFSQVDSLWEMLCPLLRTALSNITIETYKDWGTCIATACVSLSASIVMILCCMFLACPHHHFFHLTLYRRAEILASFTGFLKC